MKCKKLLAALAVTVCLFTSAVAQVSTGRTLYTVTSTGVDFAPVAINASGSMMGSSGYSYFWSEPNVLVRIPGLTDDANDVLVNDLNARGTVVGLDNYEHTAITWDLVNGTQALPGFERYNSEAFGINNLGHVCGHFTDASSKGPQPFLWKPGLGWAALPLQGGGSGGTTAVNNKNQILGGIIFSGNDQTVIWQPDGRVTYLGNMLAQTENYPNGINDLGYVCGLTYGPMGFIGYFWSPTGGYTPIYNPINPTYYTQASALNNHNAVVGAAITENGYAGFIWTPQDGFAFLNDLLAPGSTDWNVDAGYGITDNGLISATAYLNGVEYAVLLTPVHQIVAPGPKPKGATGG